MEEIEQIKRRINGDKNVVKEKKIIKFFNVILVILLVGLGGLIYCKQDENGALLKQIFNVDISFKEFNQSIENALNNVFKLNMDNEEEQKTVASLDLYHNLGSNNYSTDDKTIRMLNDGEIVISSYQDEYKYFVVINYENGISALYTLIDEIMFSDEKDLLKNDIIGTYNGDYFNCVFKKGNQTIIYNEVLK